MENNDYVVADSQFIVSIDGKKKVLVTLICNDEEEQIKFALSSDDSITDEEIERVKVTIENMINNFLNEKIAEEKCN